MKLELTEFAKQNLLSKNFGNGQSTYLFHLELGDTYLYLSEISSQFDS